MPCNSYAGSSRDRTRRRSSTARRRLPAITSSLSANAMIAVSAPTARAATAAPSSTRWGNSVSRSRSLPLAGSPSVPLPTTTRGPRRATTARIFLATGKAAPPRPRRPDRSISLISRSGAHRRSSGSDPARAKSDRGSAFESSVTPPRTRGRKLTATLAAPPSPCPLRCPNPARLAGERLTRERSRPGRRSLRCSCPAVRSRGRDIGRGWMRVRASPGWWSSGRRLRRSADLRFGCPACSAHVRASPRRRR